MTLVHLIGLFLISISGSADESKTVCSVLRTLSDFIRCMEDNHPEYTHSHLMDEEAQLLVQEARQFKNPTFSLRSVGGDNYGMGIGSSELSVTYPFPLSARRSSAVAAARANGEQIKAQAHLTRISVRDAFVKDLFRMRQIEDELKWNRFIHDQLLAQRNTYSRRTIREPEQDVFLGLVQLLIADALTKQSVLEIESRDLRSQLQRALGPQNSLDRMSWPLAKKAWPELKGSDFTNIETRPEVIETKAREEQALAEWRRAKAMTWPEFNFGPVIQRANEGPMEYYAYGIQVSFELPVLSWNLAGRALRAKQYAHAAHEVTLMEQQQNYLLETYLQQYRKSIEGQRQLPSAEEISKKAKTAQSYFQRGMIGGPALIESYRQTLDSVTNRHRLELLTLDAFLWLQTTRQRNPVAELEKVP